MSFHVPELSRDTTHPILKTDRFDGNNGTFLIESPEPGWRLMLLASDGEGWEHVSVHAYKPGRPRQHHVHHSFLEGERPYTTGGESPKDRTPTWKEMSYVKRLCWDAEDVVMQLHPRESEYVNCHPHTLHLWRPTDAEIPTPPAEFVGPLTKECV